MLFSSLLFLFGFLPIAIAAYYALWLVARAFGWPWRRPSHALLLVFSTYFYWWGERELVLVMLASTAIDFVCGLRIDQARRSGPPQAARRWLIVSIVANLGLLAFFKYASFGVATLNSVIEFGGGAPLTLPDIALPLGISFYTFQSMSYTIDVYRGTVPATRRPVDFACFVTMFPQLVAGPIVRYADLAEQLRSRTLRVASFANGVERFTMGLAKKVLIANTVAIPADAAFGSSLADLDAATAWLGIVCYSLQIYFDFSGYSDMAIGLGLMLGFRFVENFNHPYVSRTIQEFWRRWHISLSTWFRDYVYVPLGGNRQGPARTHRNLFLVFLLCGLWHGAAWNFVVWGLFHGGFLVAERSGLSGVLDKLWRPLQHAYALLVVALGWVLFRADDLGHAGGYVATMCGLGVGDRAKTVLLDPDLMLFGGLGLVLATPVVPWSVARWRQRIDRAPALIAAPLGVVAAVARPAFAVTLLASCALVLAAGSPNPFIYFRF